MKLPVNAMTSQVNSKKPLWSSRNELFFISLLTLVLLILGGCCTTQTSSLGEISKPVTVPSNPVTVPSKPDTVPSKPKAVVVVKESCDAGKFFFCRAQPIGSMRYLSPPPTSAISCGRCVDGAAQGYVIAAWCKRPDCRNVDINNARDVYGNFIGEMDNGKFKGGSAILVTELGAYYGSLTAEGGYDSGLMKMSRANKLVFIGKFNPDGSPQRGVLVEMRGNKKPVLKHGNFVNGKLEGFAHFYEEGAYTTMRCSAGNCSIYLRDIVKDQIKAVLKILLSEAIETAFLQRPTKALLLSTLPKTEVVKDIERAYDAWGRVKTIREIYEVVK